MLSPPGLLTNRSTLTLHWLLFLWDGNIFEGNPHFEPAEEDSGRAAESGWEESGLMRGQSRPGS